MRAYSADEIAVRSALRSASVDDPSAVRVGWFTTWHRANEGHERSVGAFYQGREVFDAERRELINTFGYKVGPYDQGPVRRP